MACAFRYVGDGPGFAAAKRQNRNRWGSSLANFILVAAANERDGTTVPRPARAGIVLAIGHTHRSGGAAGRHRPDGSLIPGALVVDYHARKRDTAAIGRELRIGDPRKSEEISLADGTLSSRTRC